MKIITKNPNETLKLGLTIAKKLKGGEILALSGDLGGGKTTFVKGLGKAFEIKNIKSPTFVLAKIYPLKKGKVKFFHHLDLYRLKNVREVKNLGILENLGNPNTIFAIEWAEKTKKILPRKKIVITFKYLNKNKREIEIKSRPLSPALPQRHRTHSLP